ncbi:MAG: hypothetical protein KBD53_08385 [Candidatus Omnitrophica bacterium]|nr:hypothetical protein [Candidatus Omnitrophota bacterium]
MKSKYWNILFVVLFLNFNHTTVDAMVSVNEKKTDVDYAAYSEVYIQNIDLREMTFEIYDDDKRVFEADHLDEKRLNDLAMELYENFFLNLKDVISINENQDIDPTKKALILNIKLSGRFRSEDRGLINWMITKSKAVETNLVLECQLLDAQTKEELVIIKDEHVLTSPDHEKPLSQSEELEGISDIFRVWSTRFARAIEQMRNGEAVTK